MSFLEDPRQFALCDPEVRIKGGAGAYRVDFAIGTRADRAYRSFLPQGSPLTPLKLPARTTKEQGSRS